MSPSSRMTVRNVSFWDSWWLYRSDPSDDCTTCFPADFPDPRCGSWDLLDLRCRSLNFGFVLVYRQQSIPVLGSA